MKKTEVLSVSDFLHRKEKESLPVKLKRHLDKYGFIYKIAGSVVIILVAGGGMDYAFAAGSSIDVGAKKLYYEIVKIGKWIIIFKGGMDTIKAAGSGDIEGVKKSFFSHLLIYLMLLGLPYGMDKVDEVFQSVTN
jgi:hypothetical protein